ncbi:ATP-binding protein [Vibrio sinaloensis]|uniref:ATP-binding protein n=1 Tax=Photobacterium sp. (strain ATCC 43367) TaxID=379097 RepID=UPI00057CBEAE|nr:ATP-binding protein [Vibrio sinaloensis]KHT50528.1 histidine kinase [Vibrio sinaloensis]
MVAIGALCFALILLIVNFFSSLIEIRNISPQPYVTIVSNNIAAKNKLLLLKAELQRFELVPSVQSLRSLQIKARVYKSSILQDFNSRRTLNVHEQYGDVTILKKIVSQLEVSSALIQQITLDNSQPLKIASQKVDDIYVMLNSYLSDFISQVQKDQLQFNQHKEDIYKGQFFNLGIILLCTIAMILIVSWLYFSQTKLSRDLTERTLKLEEARQLAEQSAIAKARFLANMSHEMRTPLNAIIGLSQKEHYLASDEQVKNYASLINRSGQHLLKLINSVLDLSKIEQGNVTLYEERFYCSELIDAAKTVFVEAGKEDVDVFFSHQLAADYLLMADKTKLLQVITNLGYNSLKFTHHGHVEVNLTLDSQLQSLILTVSDTGIGMSEAQLGQVFNEFTQADDSISRLYGGTGLGLSISQSLIELMGGKIDVESELEKGTTFTVRVPVMLMEQKPKVPTAATGQKVRVQASNEFAERLIKRELINADLYDEDAEVTLTYLSGREALPNEALNRHHIVLCNATMALDQDEVFRVSKPYDFFSVANAIGSMAMGSERVPDTESQSFPNSLRVLVVEDMEINQIVAQKMLSLLNVDVTIVNNGQECLDCLQNQEFDVIFMDIQMPVMDGLETLKQITRHQLAPNSAIIALTANTFDSDVNAYLSAGFDDVLAKPFQLEWMREMLEKYA